jgi:nicotinamide-nucleotide amidase
LPLDREENFLLIKLAKEVGRLLKRKHQMLVTAESCTGGWAAQAVTSVAGSSAWFERGFVTYSNDAKHELLNVSKNTLKNHGAVSEQTAREMALGALGQGKGTLAVAITGIAGPAGGSKEKPVGTVCFAWAAKRRPVHSETRHFKGGRESVRRQSVVRALEGVIEVLEEKDTEG